MPLTYKTKHLGAIVALKVLAVAILIMLLVAALAFGIGLLHFSPTNVARAIGMWPPVITSIAGAMILAWALIMEWTRQEITHTTNRAKRIGAVVQVVGAFAAYVVWSQVAPANIYECGFSTLAISGATITACMLMYRSAGKAH